MRASDGHPVGAVSRAVVFDSVVVVVVVGGVWVSWMYACC
jgi:hypothetical protein